jgi:hypothetical protein
MKRLLLVSACTFGLGFWIGQTGVLRNKATERPNSSPFIEQNKADNNSKQNSYEAEIIGLKKNAQDMSPEQLAAIFAKDSYNLDLLEVGTDISREKFLDLLRYLVSFSKEHPELLSNVKRLAGKLKPAPLSILDDVFNVTNFSTVDKTDFAAGIFKSWFDSGGDQNAVKNKIMSVVNDAFLASTSSNLLL